MEPSEHGHEAEQGNTPLPPVFSPVGQSQVRYTRLGLVLLIVGSLLGWIPFVGTLGTIVLLVGISAVFAGRRAFGRPHDLLVRVGTGVILSAIVTGILAALVFGVQVAVAVRDGDAVDAANAHGSFVLCTAVLGVIAGVSQVMIVRELENRRGRLLLYAGVSLDIVAGILLVTLALSALERLASRGDVAGVSAFASDVPLIRLLGVVPAVVYATGYYVAHERVCQMERPVRTDDSLRLTRLHLLRLSVLMEAVFVIAILGFAALQPAPREPIEALPDILIYGIAIVFPLTVGFLPYQSPGMVVVSAGGEGIVGGGIAVVVLCMLALALLGKGRPFRKSSRRWEAEPPTCVRTLTLLMLLCAGVVLVEGYLEVVVALSRGGTMSVMFSEAPLNRFLALRGPILLGLGLAMSLAASRAKIAARGAWNLGVGATLGTLLFSGWPFTHVAVASAGALSLGCLALERRHFSGRIVGAARVTKSFPVIAALGVVAAGFCFFDFVGTEQLTWSVIVTPAMAVAAGVGLLIRNERSRLKDKRMFAVGTALVLLGCVFLPLAVVAQNVPSSSQVFVEPPRAGVEAIELTVAIDAGNVVVRHESAPTFLVSIVITHRQGLFAPHLAGDVRIGTDFVRGTYHLIVLARSGTAFVDSGHDVTVTMDSRVNTSIQATSERGDIDLNLPGGLGVSGRGAAAIAENGNVIIRATDIDFGGRLWGKATVGHVLFEIEQRDPQTSRNDPVAIRGESAMGTVRIAFNVVAGIAARVSCTTANGLIHTDPTKYAASSGFLFYSPSLEAYNSAIMKFDVVLETGTGDIVLT